MDPCTCPRASMAPTIRSRCPGRQGARLHRRGRPPPASRRDSSTTCARRDGRQRHATVAATGGSRRRGGGPAPAWRGRGGPGQEAHGAVFLHTSTMHHRRARAAERRTLRGCLVSSDQPECAAAASRRPGVWKSKRRGSRRLSPSRLSVAEFHPAGFGARRARAAWDRKGRGTGSRGASSIRVAGGLSEVLGTLHDPMLDPSVLFEEGREKRDERAHAGQLRGSRRGDPDPLRVRLARRRLEHGGTAVTGERRPGRGVASVGGWTFVVGGFPQEGQR